MDIKKDMASAVSVPCRWRKAQETEKFLGEAFLKRVEKYCVAACERYRHLNFVEDHAWLLETQADQTAAMLLHSRCTLFPVLNGTTSLNIPPYIYRALSNINICALHGLSSDIAVLLQWLTPLKLNVAERVEYHLMALDGANDLCMVKPAPRGLTLRRPELADIPNILPLQIAYEREEVLPTGALLDPRSTMLNLTRIIAKERSLIAELGGTIVGKINTNAQAYSRCQIGGVYVLPEYRGMGIAANMTAAFARFLLAAGFGMTLFVQKANRAALRTYRNSGFKLIADYSLVYC